MNNESALVFPKYEMTDRLFAAVYLVVGYCFIYVFTGTMDVGTALSAFTVFYAAVVLAYLHGKKIRPSKESWFWLAILLAIGVPYGFWSILPLLQVQALLLVAAYWTLAASGRLLLENKTSQWILFDCWNAMAVVPFHNFCQFHVLTKDTREEPGDSRRENHLGAVFLGIAIAVPVLIIILPLLVRADAGFQLMVGGIMEYICVHLLGIFLRAAFAIPVSEYLFGLVFGGIHGRNTDRIHVEKLQETGKRVRKVPDTAVCTALTVICVVYLLFIGLQSRYLFAAFAGVIPQGFTYAEYARRGFFELCQIGAWNLVFLGCAGAFSRTDSREHKGLGLLTVLLSVLTLLLIITAISKLGMYISVYGLTVNRVLPFVFMLWMALVFISIIIRQRKIFPMARFCVMAGAVMFCLLCVFPVEDWIRLYNMWARARGYIL